MNWARFRLWLEFYWIHIAIGVILLACTLLPLWYLSRLEESVARYLIGINIISLPGTLINMSALFFPLTVGEHALGVMTVQAPHSHAYGENERLIFRTLCAYGAIALDNAEAYRQLQDAQAQQSQGWPQGPLH